MDKQITCDIAIIGAGAGGLSLAAGASQLGLKVILLEKDKMGGDCLNTGCVPSKSLLAAAKNYWQANHSQALGLKPPVGRLDFKQVMAHVQQVITTLAVHDSIERFESLGVRIIQAAGRFIDEHRLEAEGYQIKARYMVIATGSSPAIPSIPGLNKNLFYTNESIFNLRELPQHLLVIGGGPVGCELAQAFAMLGSKVTLIEGQRLLGHDDADSVEILRQSLLDKGVEVLENTEIIAVAPGSQQSILIQAKHQQQHCQFEASHLLVATGRKPNLYGLDCEKAGVNYNAKGVLVDKHLRSSNPKVFAIGDVAGSLQFTHVANEQAGLVLRQIAFKLPASFRIQAIPWVTYTSPELAQVGSTEQQLIASNTPYVSLKLDYASNDRAQTEGQNKGFIKVLVTKKGRILGATIVGENAGELLYPWVIALSQGKTLKTFINTIPPYPTLNELSKRIAGQFYAPKLFSPAVKKLVRFLSWF